MQPINLLPWRELQRARELRQWRGCLFIASGLAVGFVLLLNQHQKGRVNQQLLLNQQLQLKVARVQQTAQGIQTLSTRINQLRSHTQQVQRIVNEHRFSAHLLHALVEVIPIDVFLTRIEYQNNHVSLQGITHSAGATTMMHHLEQVSWAQSPQLIEIKLTQRQGRQSQREQSFHVRFSLGTMHESNQSGTTEFQ